MVLTDMLVQVLLPYYCVGATLKIYADSIFLEDVLLGLGDPLRVGDIMQSVAPIISLNRSWPFPFTFPIRIGITSEVCALKDAGFHVAHTCA